MTQIPNTANQQGTFETREEVLAIAGAQQMATSRYELSELEEIEFFYGNRQVELDAVFRPGIDSPLSPTAFNDSERGEKGSCENPFVLDEKEEKDSSLSSTLVSERPTEPPRSRPLGRWIERIESVPEFVYRTLFERKYSVYYIV